MIPAQVHTPEPRWRIEYRQRRWLVKTPTGATKFVLNRLPAAHEIATAMASVDIMLAAISEHTHTTARLELVR